MDSVKFFNGMKMPIVGLGTWQAVDLQESETALDSALNIGYRHIDTAYTYENEELIGRTLKSRINSGSVKREDLFIVTKLPSIGLKPELVSHFLNKQLKSLQLDYIDLYLIHLPVGFKYKDDKTLFPFEDGEIAVDMETNLERVWKAMEEQVDMGKAKSIGLSNVDCTQIERILNIARIQPANIQVELHAYCQQKSIRETCAKYNISVCAYAPFASPGRKQIWEQMTGTTWEPLPLMDDPVVLEIAKSHGKTVPQILLRFLTQQGIAVIPKSINVDRIKENIDIFDFSFTEDELESMRALDKGEKGKTFVLKDIFPGITKHPEYPGN